MGLHCDTAKLSQFKYGVSGFIWCSSLKRELFFFSQFLKELFSLELKRGFFLSFCQPFNCEAFTHKLKDGEQSLFSERSLCPCVHAN